MPENSNITWFSYLLTSSHLKWVRCLLLCLLMLLFSLGDTGYQYHNVDSGIMPFIILCFVSTICKIFPIFFMLKVIMPRFLPKHQYGHFWSLTFAVIFTSLLSQHALEFLTCNVYGLPFWRLQHMGYFSFYLIDFAVQFVQWLIVLIGISMGYLLSYWLNERNRKQIIEASKLQMESELLKEQVSPEFLCNTLHKCGELTLSDSKEASQRLMLLSKLLRYQLYDCKRREVLLDGELKFLSDYMQLNKLNGFCKDYSLDVEGKSFGVFVPPLLFVSLISVAQGYVNMKFVIEKDKLIFTVDYDEHQSLSEYEQFRLRDRLQHIFSDDFILMTNIGYSKIIIPL